MPNPDGEPNLSREEVLRRLAEAVGGDPSGYAVLLQPSVWLRVDDSREPGLMESRFGGPAMMPPDFEWPMYTAEPYMGRDPNDDPDTFVLWYAKQQKLPMWLIAQLNLAEIPAETPLPREGLLSFFYDPFDGPWGHSKADQQGARIIYVPPERFVELVPHEKPEVVVHPGAFADWKWPLFHIEFVTKWSFSDSEALHRLNRLQQYHDAAERVGEVMKQPHGYSFGHFLLDAGRNHQEDPREQAAYTLDPIPRVPTYEERGYEPSDEEHEARQKAIEDFGREWVTVLSLVFIAPTWVTLDEET